MESVRLTVDEIVSYLKRTSLPTVVVEGTDDKSIYRYIESKLDSIEVDVFNCGGRASLLEIYERRSELQQADIAFLADKDMWHFTEIPDKYKQGMAFSSGYSIENDIYNKDVFESLLEQNELEEFSKLVLELSRWFAFEVTRFKRDGFSLCDVHINQITKGSALNQEYLNKINYVEPDANVFEGIFNSYHSSLRGKNLFQAILRFLSSSKRKSKYSRQNLIELGCKLNAEFIEKIKKDVESQLNAQQVAPADVSLAALANRS